MEAHKCVPIVMQIGLTIWMIANPNQIMSFLLGNGVIS
jgi:hypothetical protein